MLFSANDNLWKQEKEIQDRIQQKIVDQEICWAQKGHQNWINFGDKNTKFFQTAPTIRKRQNFIHKIEDENGIWSKVQNAVSQVFFDGFLQEV